MDHSNLEEPEREQQSERGLFGGFEGYRVPSDAQAAASIQTALVSVDANVLLDLYRYPDDLTYAVLDAFAALGDRLFISDQALTEFWRNRMSTLEDRAKAKFEATKRLSDLERSTKDAIDTWARKISLDESEVSASHLLLQRQFDNLKARIDDNHTEDSENYPSPSLDVIVQALEPILRGRVGAPLSGQQYEECLKEGKRRHANQLPPGYKEKPGEKEHLPEGVAGDYLVWYQSMVMARDRGLDLLLLTRDEKDDWWWRWRETVIGPRPELSAEFWQFSHHDLFMMTPLVFMRTYKELGGDVSDAALNEAVREEPVAATQNVRVDAADQDVGGEWTANAVHRLLALLDANSPVQANVIRAAAEKGGILDRGSIYAIGNYDPRRMLRGFTRPVRRFTRQLQEEGIIPLDVPSMLQPRYDFGVQANAFEVPASVVGILTRTSTNLVS